MAAKLISLAYDIRIAELVASLQAIVEAYDAQQSNLDLVIAEARALLRRHSERH